MTFCRSGIPSARFVLLKAFGESGYTFYTNSESRKGREIVSTLSIYCIYFYITITDTLEPSISTFYIYIKFNCTSELQIEY